MGNVHKVAQGKGGEQGPSNACPVQSGPTPSVGGGSRKIVRRGASLCFLGRRLRRVQTNQGSGGVPHPRRRIVAPCMHTGASWQNTSMEPWRDPPRRHRNSDASRENFRSRSSGVERRCGDSRSGEGCPCVGSSQWQFRKCFQRISGVLDLQSAWLLLLHCGATRATFWLCMVRPELTGNVWQCFAKLLGLPEGQPAVAVSMPSNQGGLGLGSAVQSRRAAH